MTQLEKNARAALRELADILGKNGVEKRELARRYGTTPANFSAMISPTNRNPRGVDPERLALLGRHYGFRLVVQAEGWKVGWESL